MFTKQVIQHVIWSRQKDHALPIASRSVPVNFSLGPRSSLVRLSLVYRRPIENRTRNKRKTNERATNIDRDADEKLSATRRNATILAGCTSFCNHKPTQCLSPKSAEANPCTSSPHWTFPWRIKPFRPSRRIQWSNHAETPSTGF